MWTREQSKNGGARGGPQACSIERHCSVCKQTFRGPVYFKHIKSKKHYARLTHTMHLHRGYDIFHP